jgi:muconolactone delta-isomerase
MKFLVISNPSFPVPAELALDLVNAMEAWIGEHTRSGKIEASWSYAGMNGGGGILNVESLDELDAIMLGYPYGPFSDVEAIPLVDLGGALERMKQGLQAMAGG